MPKTLILVRRQTEADNLNRALRKRTTQPMVPDYTAMSVAAVSAGHRFDRIWVTIHPELDVLPGEIESKRQTRIQSERAALDENWRCTLRPGGQMGYRPLSAVWEMVYESREEHGHG